MPEAKKPSLFSRSGSVIKAEPAHSAHITFYLTQAILLVRVALRRSRGFASLDPPESCVLAVGWLANEGPPSAGRDGRLLR